MIKAPCVARSLLLLALFLLAPSFAFAGFELELDLDTAATIVSLAGRDVTDDELERVASLEGSQALIRQSSRFNPAATGEVFVDGLRAFAAGRDPQPDPFAFSRLRERLVPTRALIGRLTAEPAAFKRAVIGRMTPYAPAVDFTAKLTFVVGGSSDGFSPGRGRLFVALDYFRDDFDGAVLLAAHELYHALQGSLLDSSGVAARVDAMTGRHAEATRLLLSTLKEGTASLVGDPLTIGKPGVYNSWFAEKFRRNEQRIAQNFALFETMLFRIANDDVKLETIYPIGFSGSWDSPLYFVGYRMAKVIETYDGRAAVADSCRRGPVEFFLRYSALAAGHAGDPDVVPLGASTRAILAELAESEPKPRASN